jgi:DNA-binding transcriptional regulator YdaS (Cro superfamily)
MSSALLSYLSRARGAQKATAVALDIDRVTLYRWARNGVPAEKLIEVERVTGIARSDLRPDLYAASEYYSTQGAA